MAGLPPYLPLLDGWEHLWKTFLPGDINPRRPGDSFSLLKEKERGWGWSVVTMSRSTPFYKLTIAVDDFTERYNILEATPFFTNLYGLNQPNDHIWTPLAGYTAGVFMLVFCPAIWSPYRKFVEIKITAPNRNPVTGAAITAPTVVEGAFVCRIKVVDEDAFVKSVRKLNTPIEIS